MLNKINRIIIANVENFKDLDVNEYLDTVQYCREHGSFFLRASNSVFRERIIDPQSRRKRKTLYANNIQEFLIDENPLWSDFPKRLRSLIGLGVRLSLPDTYSPRDFHLTMYGSELYYVFPKNLFSGGVAFIEKEDLIGLLKRKTSYDETYDFYSDIMNLFNLGRNYHFDSMSDFETHCSYVDNDLKELYKYLESIELTYDTSYQSFVKLMNDKDLIGIIPDFVQNIIEIFINLDPSSDPVINVSNNKTAEIFFINFIREVKKCLDMGFKKYLWHIMEPDKCYVLDPSDFDYIDNVEFWTDEECLLVNAEYITEFYDEVENYLE